MAMPPVADDLEVGLSLILTPLRIETRDDVQVAHELPTPSFEDLAQIFSDLSLLSAVLYDHMEERWVDQPQPDVAYLHLNTPAWIIAIAKGAKPSTWVDEFAEFIGAIWAFPSTVTAARDERRLRAAQASTAVRNALNDPRLEAMDDRGRNAAFEVLQVEKGEPQKLIEAARVASDS